VEKNLNSKTELFFLLKEKKYKKIFIITGQNSFYKSGANKIIEKLVKNINVKLYFKKSYYPEINELKEIVTLINKFSPDLVIAVGGGAVMDYAKMSNIIPVEYLENIKDSIINYHDIGYKKKNILIALPTTAGSGAEMTSNAVIYINKVKYSIENKLLIPDHFFLIPSFILNNPKKIKSSSGFDAIAQSVESLISQKSNKQSIFFAKQSLELTNKSFLNFINKPSTNNATKMLLAANLSGKAINISKTTAPHAISYPFTAMFGINHGHAVSLFFEKFLRFNYLNLDKSSCSFDLNKRYQIIFDKFNVKDINELCLKIKFYKKSSGLEDNFKKLNINLDKNVEKILNGVNPLRLKNNPISITRKDLKNILLNEKF
jgi:alcohol dehydrogenase